MAARALGLPARAEAPFSVMPLLVPVNVPTRKRERSRDGQAGRTGASSQQPGGDGVGVRAVVWGPGPWRVATRLRGGPPLQGEGPASLPPASHATPATPRSGVAGRRLPTTSYI